MTIHRRARHAAPRRRRSHLAVFIVAGLTEHQQRSAAGSWRAAPRRRAIDDVLGEAEHVLQPADHRFGIPAAQGRIDALASLLWSAILSASRAIADARRLEDLLPRAPSMHDGSSGFTRFEPVHSLETLRNRFVRACQPAVDQRQTPRPGGRRLAGQFGEFADQMGLVGISRSRPQSRPSREPSRFAPAGRLDGSASCARSDLGARPSSDRKRSTSACGSSRCRRPAPRSARRRRCSASRR